MSKKIFNKNKDKYRGKVKVGWQKTKKRSSFWKKIKGLNFNKSSKKIVQNVIIRPKKISVTERIVKSIIWIALRLAIRPKHWKDDRKNYQIIDRAYKRIMATDFLFIPPAFAFYLIMAFMPIILLTLLIVSNVPEISSFVTTTLDKFTNGNSSAFTSITQHVKSAGAISTLIIMILISLWVASGGFAKFIYTESYVYEHEKFGGYWMNKFRGMFIVICVTLYSAIGLILISIIPWLIEKMGLDSNEKPTIYEIVYYLIISAGSFTGIYIGIVLLFMLSPRFKQTWKQVHPGVLAATIPTSGFIILFTLLTKVFFRYQGYGILGMFMTMAASMFWISYFIYVGLIVNVVFYKTHYGEKTFSKKTISKK